MTHCPIVTGQKQKYWPNIALEYPTYQPNPKIFPLAILFNFIKVDLRTVSFDVPPQEVLSRDSVTVSVDAVVYYR